MGISNYFTNRESGVTIRVEKVTENFASITVVKQLPSTFMMPVAQYDTDFVHRYLPLDIGSIKTPDSFRPPANADVWAKEQNEVVQAKDAEEQKQDSGVKIGGDDDAPKTLDEAYALVKDIATR